MGASNNGVVRSAFFVVCLLVFAPHAYSADAGAPYDRRGEIAWARATWPEDLAGLRFDSELPKLRRWFAAGRPLLAYVHTPDHACRPIDLRPSDIQVGGEIDPSVAFVGRVELDDRLAKADRSTSRSFDELRVGDALTRLPDVKVEARNADGKWEAAGSTGYDAEPTVYGALSQVDGAVARFGGQNVYLRTTCRDPHDWLPCAGGGGRYCQRCEQIGVRVIDAQPSLEGESYHGPEPQTCHEKCPASTESPLAKRLRDLAGRVSIWRPGKMAPNTAPSLYRSRETCLREHPLRAAPKK
jgi:hypothetical protein